MDKIIKKIEGVFSEQAKTISSLTNDLKTKEDEFKSINKALLLDFIQIIDTFEQAEAIVEERRWNENEIADKAIKRLLTAKKKALSILEKHKVTQMAFDNNLANDESCKTVDTEYSDDYPENYILSIEKKGYTVSFEKNGQITTENLRLAEVVIVRK